MATWQVGPFDNDDAVEWCATVEAAAPDRRLGLVAAALDAAIPVACGFTLTDARRAVAAAATVLQSLTDAQPSDSPYAPRFLLGSRDIPVGLALRDRAAEAMNAILADGSSWRLRWAGDVEEEEALAVAKALQAALSLAAPVWPPAGPQPLPIPACPNSRP